MPQIYRRFPIHKNGMAQRSAVLKGKKTGIYGDWNRDQTQ